MKLRKFTACTVCLVTVLAASGCADGTGQALTPTLPTVQSTTSNADGTKLKASAPQPLSPRSAVRISNLTPQLVLQNGSGTFAPSAGLSYIFEVFEVAGPVQTLVAKSDAIPAGVPQTVWDIPANTLKLNKTYAWRAYAMYADVAGSLSDGVSFRTPLPPPVDGPVACGSNAGLDIVRCVGRAYPAYLVPTEQGSNSLERRKVNMAFIRDRVIETGICQGLDLARNFKRGTPEISFDFLVWRSHRDHGVDIATGFDELKLPIRLKWQVFGADDNYGFPFYAKYPPVDCTNLADPSQAQQ
jgi:hypothetical protein